jgi:uncharacterized membrane protein
MKPLIVLLTASLVAACAAKVITGNWSLIFAGNAGMCAMLLLTAMGHFKFTRGMISMVPSGIPFKKQLVYATGIAEMAIGIALLVPALRGWAGSALIGLLCVMLPANIYAARNHINYETGELNGPGPGYLWFRIPLQLFFIAWTGYFAIA